jgi:c-di-GMP-binding flagellar brake protein YcgR
MASVIEENLEEFTSTSPREVAFNLRKLAQSGERISVIFDDGRESFLTVLLDIDEDTGLLYFDWGGVESTNQKILKSDRNFFVCSPAGIRNQFMVGKVWGLELNKRRAFATRLPQRYIRLQRREFFRLTLPYTQRPTCRIALPETDRHLDLPVVDIGIGGIGLEFSGARIDYAAGTIFPNSAIDLGAFGRLNVNVEIRYTTHVLRHGKEISHIGCRFATLGGAMEHNLQRYLTHIQREIKAHSI